MKTVTAILDSLASSLKATAKAGDSRFTGCVCTSETNIECVVQELQIKGYWTEYRRIGGSDNYIIKIEW